jgi:tryptophan synthase alpha chain
MTENRLTQTFAGLRARSEKALVAFITAGDPLPDRTADVIVALAEAGADVVELGIPFSDPLADGPTIQASSLRALVAGMTPPKVLEIVREARKRTQVPLVLMGSWNPVMQYGMERFTRDAVAAGADGTILTDLSPEEAGEWKRIADAANLATVFLLAPTSTMARMALVGKMASGFIYCVSRTGITGVGSVVPSDLPPLVSSIRQRAHGTPVCVGFGISEPEHVAAVCDIAEGAVVGSALVTLLHKERDNPDLLRLAAEYITRLKEATGTCPPAPVPGGRWLDESGARRPQGEKL